jgi:hypothetical protein
MNYNGLISSTHFHSVKPTSKDIIATAYVAKSISVLLALKKEVRMQAVTTPSILSHSYMSKKEKIMNLYQADRRKDWKIC